MRNVFAIALLSLAMVAPPPSAHAVGCLSGAVVGGTAGHVAGHHGFIGALGGCAVGHHLAVQQRRQRQLQQQQMQQQQMQQQSNGPTASPTGATQ